MKIRAFAIMILVGMTTWAAGAAADWPAAHGNAQRTGNVDGKAGPVKGGKVVWVYESTDHFLSTGSPGEGVFYVPALGTLNSGVMTGLSTEAGAQGPKRVVWSKTQPAIKLPTVCPPAVVGGRIIFGD